MVQMKTMMIRLRNRASERAFCKAASIGRSSLRYIRKSPSLQEQEEKQAIVGLANRHRYMGTPRVKILLERLGYFMNHKKLERIWREECLQVPRPKPRRRRNGTPGQLGIRAKGPNEVWCHDFLYQRTRYGRQVKILVLLDEYTRECLAIRVGDKLDSEDVKSVLKKVVARRGNPRYIRSDNGSEFIAGHLQSWMVLKGITPLYIAPGSPWQNGFVESFNGKLRKECLDRETFGSMKEIEVVLMWWQEIYNHYRPHSALGYKTPAEMAPKGPSATLQGPWEHASMKEKLWLLN